MLVNTTPGSFKRILTSNLCLKVHPPRSLCYSSVSVRLKFFERTGIHTLTYSQPYSGDKALKP